MINYRRQIAKELNKPPAEDVNDIIARISEED